MTTILMRCTTPHWQGDKFIDAGTVRPQGHPEAIPAYFEPFVIDEETPKPAAKKTSAKAGTNE